MSIEKNPQEPPPPPHKTPQTNKKQTNKWNKQRDKRKNKSEELETIFSPFCCMSIIFLALYVTTEIFETDVENRSRWEKTKDIDSRNAPV